jgi:hypothetical protein
MVWVKAIIVNPLRAPRQRVFSAAHSCNITQEFSRRGRPLYRLLGSDGVAAPVGCNASFGREYL